MQRRDRQALREEAAMTHKRELGRTMLDAILEGRARPEFAGPLMNDMQASFDRRRPRGGFAGLLGQTEEPDMPMLDMLMSGNMPFQGPGGFGYSPEEMATREQRIKFNTTMNDRKQELDWLTKLAETTPSLGLDKTQVQKLALGRWYNQNFLGVRGTASDYYDPQADRVIRGRPDPLGEGIIDEATGLIVPGATSVKLQRSTDNSGVDTWVDMHTGRPMWRTQTGRQAFGLLPNAFTGGANPWMWMPGVGPQLGPWQQGPPPGTPGLNPNANTPPPTDINGPYQMLQNRRAAVEAQIKTELEANQDEFEMAQIDGLGFQYQQNVRDRVARMNKFASYQDMLNQVNAFDSTRTARPGRAPVGGAGAAVPWPAVPGTMPAPGAAPNMTVPGQPVQDGQQMKDKANNTFTIRRR